ncbi:hypothetical protein [Macrococcoides caseolyticum]|uniref:hypothetical protein n=1 Tax=Macrococcoides caseolyticum TaxID=69966 RepID=UPI001F281B1B|nr:hypothetical protein [Macrococcus caseolyticus]MCE4957465.1 hypothetical protein [Macrococcus caseolyticus]
MNLINNLFECINSLIETPLFSKIIIPFTLLYIGSSIINKSIEKIKHNNSMDLQAESFYKERSGQEIQTLLLDWSDLVLNMQKIKDMTPSDFQSLFQKSFVYGSERTVNLVSAYQQHNYKFKIEEDEDIKEEHNYKSLVFVAMIVSSLKRDFTNQNVDPLQILKIKLTDYDDKKMRKYFNNIEKEI